MKFSADFRSIFQDVEIECKKRFIRAPKLNARFDLSFKRSRLSDLLSLAVFCTASLVDSRSDAGGRHRSVPSGNSGRQASGHSHGTIAVAL